MDEFSRVCPSAMPVSKTNPSQVPPSSVSIGKKPMNYTTNQQQPQQAQQQGQQQQPKSARAAAKAPAFNTQQQQQQPQQNRQTSPPNSNASTTNKGRSGVGGGSASANGPTSSQKGKANANKIWSTSTTEERERIKEFWLGLGEQERRNLVKIEKDTVLRKMKEQQKHSCSCAVCGRKRFVLLFFSSFSAANDPLLTCFLPLFFQSLYPIKKSQKCDRGRARGTVRCLLRGARTVRELPAAIPQFWRSNSSPSWTRALSW